jgi:hypothetical protein
MYVMRKNLARVIPPLLPSLPIHIERQITRMIYGLQIQYRWEGGGGARLRKEIAGGARRKERGVEKWRKGVKEGRGGELERKEGEEREKVDRKEERGRKG